MLMIDMMGEMIDYTYFILYGITIVFSLLVAAVVHILQSIGLSRMAKACHYPHPGFAWIPLVNFYVMGKIAEISAARFGKKKRPYGKLMLWMQIVTTVLAVAIVLVMLSVLTGGVPVADYNASTIADDSFSEALTLLTILPFSLLLMALSVITLVIHYIVLFQIFKLFDEKNAILYTILCIAVTYAQPILFLILSTKTPYQPAEPPANATLTADTAI